MDNLLIAFECIHAIPRTNGEEFCAYKLDLSKTYQRVDWGFLKRLMEHRAFGQPLTSSSRLLCGSYSHVVSGMVRPRAFALYQLSHCPICSHG
jgi:hypothetical protein